MAGVIQTKAKRFSILPFVISGTAFVLYPMIRPFSDETSMQGAAAFASVEWMVSHILGMIAFTFLPLGFLEIFKTLEKGSLTSSAYNAVILSIIGIGFTLPYYGGETFGLHAIGHEALRQQSENLVSLEAIVRSGPGLIMFIIGLVLLGVSSIVIARTLWKSGKHLKWSGVPLAAGMILYLPQFLANQPFRVAHGLLVGFGCFLIAWKINRSGK